MTEIIKLDSMYNLSKEYETALSMVDEDWVLTDEALELLNSSKLDIIKKSENIFWVIRSLEAREINLKNEKQYLNSKQNILKNNIEKLRQLVSMWLDTIWATIDDKWKKTQKITTDKWTCYYIFKEEVKYNESEIEEKYRVKKTKLRMSDKFDLEKLKEIAPDMVEMVEFEEIDYDLLKFDYTRAEEWNKPKWVQILENKTLTIKG